MFDARTLRDLYQEVILDHSRVPRNFGDLPGADRRAEGRNPVCGDHVTVFLKLGKEEGDTIEDLRFVGSGCAISKASASLMTAALKGKTRAGAEELFGRFHKLVTGGNGDEASSAPEADADELGSLVALAGVREFPVRVKCATLAWHTLRAALKQSGEVVSTE